MSEWNARLYTHHMLACSLKKALISLKLRRFYDSCFQYFSPLRNQHAKKRTGNKLDKVSVSLFCPNLYILFRCPEGEQRWKWRHTHTRTSNKTQKKKKHQGVNASYEELIKLLKYRVNIHPREDPLCSPSEWFSQISQHNVQNKCNVSANSLRPMRFMINISHYSEPQGRRAGQRRC